ncbi:MAG: hypothetical protein Q4E88_03900 [Coriobacteriia bacterium]|nr:hypothetical protein [Coriobacteriia bacterium]
MTKRKIKFLPVFLIACLCLVASLGFASVNAFADNDNSVNDTSHKVTFSVEHIDCGKIEGSTDYMCENHSRILTNADDSILKIFNPGSMETIEIKAVPRENLSFDHWSRGDGKDFNADITTDVAFLACFKLNPGYVRISTDLFSFPDDYGRYVVPEGSIWHFDCSGDCIRHVQVIYNDKIVASFRPKDPNGCIPYYDEKYIKDGEGIYTSSTLYDKHLFNF